MDNLELNKIYNEDCRTGMLKVPDSIDLIVTSPPYNCGIEYDSWNDKMPWDDYANFTWEWLDSAYTALKDDGRICVNVLLDMGNNRTELGRQSPMNLVYNIMKTIGYGVHGFVLWTDNHRVKYTAWGSWLSPSAPYIYCPYETIVIGYKNEWKKKEKGEATISKEEFMEGVSGIWNLGTESNSKTKASFPLALPERCIRLLSWKGDIVLDPFMGSGTTAIAAMKTKRSFIGFEISEEYTKIANERITSVQEDLF